MSIQSEINRIAGAKSDIADAIEDKGGTLPSGATIDDMADGVRSIPQGSGTSDYDDLTNKPQINGVTLSGNKSLSDIGAAAESDLEDLQNSKADVIVSTASGPIASFTDGADGMPVKGLKLTINPVQAGSGDPSPTNVRPITGHTGVNVYREDEYDAESDPVIAIPFPSSAGTVYGGSLDVTNGVLTVTHAKRAVTSSDNAADILAGTNNNGNRLAINLANVNPKSLLNILCSIGAPNNAALDSSDWKVGDCRLYNYNSVMSLLYVVPNEYTTKDAAKQFLLDNGAEIVYEIATPLTYQLTPAELTTLLGQNNIWHDANGDTEVVYCADTTDVVDEIRNSLNSKADQDDLTSLNLTGTTNTTGGQIDAGTFFYLNGMLVKAKRDIAANASFTKNTNYEEVTAGGLNDLLSSYNNVYSKLADGHIFFLYFVTSQTITRTINLANSFRGILISSSNYTTHCGIAAVAINVSGVPNVTKMVGDEGYTFQVDVNNKVTVVGTQNARHLLICLGNDAASVQE